MAVGALDLGSTPDAFGTICGSGVLTLDLFAFLGVDDRSSFLYPQSLSAFTECSAPGYAELPLSILNREPQTGGYTMLVHFETSVWTFTGQGSPAETIYSAIAYDKISGLIVFKYLLPSPYAIPSAGGTLRLQLQLGFTSAPAAEGTLSPSTLVYAQFYNLD